MPDRRLTAYVSSMVRNAWIDARRRPRFVHLEPQHWVDAPDLAQRLDLQLTLDALREAFSRVRARRPAMAPALHQLDALARGEMAMDDLVAQVRRPGEAHATVRDRLYKRHLRARAALRGELDALVREGGIGGDVRDAAYAFIQDLLRRRRG